VWVDGWIFRRFPVTTREYRTFLDDLLATGRVEDAERFAPRLRGEAPGTLGAPLLRRTERGFELPAPDGPNAVLDDAPVMLVDWFGAHAYALWMSARTGHDWGLPRDIAWEKAARGVDGRLYPWGNRFDSSWLCMRDSRGDRQAPAPVDTFPVDASVYGVRGLAGNVRDWCAEVFLRGGPTVRAGREVPSESDNVPAAVHLMRGGTWFGDTSIGRTTDRYGMAPYFRYEDTGFRIVRRVTASRRS
jgi:formylglycine-generating enzyme required for sulfatase activity